MKHTRGRTQFDLAVIASQYHSPKTDKAASYNHKQKELIQLSTKPSMRLRSHTCLLSIFAVCLGFSMMKPVLAQSTFGSVRGIVQDNTGASVPDSQVILHSTDENTERTANADESGNFTFENVRRVTTAFVLITTDSRIRCSMVFRLMHGRTCD